MKSKAASAETLGNFIEFASRVFETAQSWKRRERSQNGKPRLREVVDRFFDPTEDVEREIVTGTSGSPILRRDR